MSAGHVRTKSHHGVSCVVRVLSRAWGGQAPGIHTRRTQRRRRQGTVVAAPLGTGRAAVWLRLATTRHFPCLVKQQTHTAAPTSTTHSTGVHESAPHAVHSTSDARHELLCVRGRSSVVFRSVCQVSVGFCPLVPRRSAAVGRRLDYPACRPLHRPRYLRISAMFFDDIAFYFSQ